MTASEWRKKGQETAEVVDLTLPSGMVIRARRPGPLQLASWERLPLTLAAIDDMIAGVATMTREAADGANQFLRQLIAYCCIEPRIGDGPEEISLREVPDPDLQFIVGWGMRLQEAVELRPFRRQRAGVDGADRGEAVVVPAVGAAGDRRSGAGAGVRPGGDAAGDGSER